MGHRIAMTAAGLLASWGLGTPDHLASAATARRAQEWAQTEEWTLPREGAATLQVTNQAGNVKIVGHAEDTLRVVAEKKVRADAQPDAAAFFPTIKIERRRVGDRWLIDATWPEPRSASVRNAYVNFEIRVPCAMRVEGRTGGGNVAASAVGAAVLRTNGGNMSANDIPGPLDLHTEGGNVDVKGCGDTRVRTAGGNVSIAGATGTVDIETGGGNLDLQRCEGPVTVRTGGGNITVHAGRGPLKATTGGGNIDARIAHPEGASQVELSTGAGNIALSLPDGVSARLSASTGIGRVSMEPSDRARLKASGQELEALLGSGTGSVRLRTGAGNIDIRATSR